ncbi:MAG: biotin/lipoate A/B protein ligase family protein, partial [Candidatus Sericytochromatia bacterium]
MTTGAWRLLDTGEGDGAWNMAVDEAILEAHRLELVPPTLRVYRWARPTLSLGYAQRWTGPSAEGIDVVRRPTGGRAVLHAGDFTYAVVTKGLPEGVKASYERLATGLARAIACLGLETQVAPGTLGAARSADCFAASTQADLQAAGRKLIGSAQTRRAGAVLQHGSLYLRYPSDLAAEVFGDADREVADLAGLLGREPAWDEVKQAFVSGLSEELGARFEPGELTPWENEKARVLVAARP